MSKCLNIVNKQDIMKISNKLTPILRCQHFDRRGYPAFYKCVD